MCFNVKNAVLFPSEVEKGLWPENYSLSDHARLTVVFSPQQIWNPTWSDESEGISQGRMAIRENTEQLAMSLDLKNTVLFSPEAEKGMWPETYSLSDHPRLTAASPHSRGAMFSTNLLVNTQC
eukprot:TRINITY_DN10521_c5_g1_i1.p1 TRINITY_DN10521_c5_g1~~TRINITY_DN10521_c5_g1_i1.p1  ORF type:complete len:123 (+),score=28.28 TRINITY_DN10521_c5_g1_i1:329-697(+)